MKILVCITDFGISQRQYLADQLSYFNSMKNLGWQVDIFIFHTDAMGILKNSGADNIYFFQRDKNLGDLLTWEHRKEMIENRYNYDLYIYTENDLAITDKHISSFMQTNMNLPEPYVAGFIHFEYGEHSEKMLMPLNKKFPCFEEQPAITIDGKDYLCLANKHQASYIITRRQLNYMIDKGTYRTDPHFHQFDQQYYHFKETAASSPYTEGGLIKLIDLENIDDFMIHHMPNHYVKNAVSELFNHPFYSLTEIKQKFSKLPPVLHPMAEQKPV